MSSELILSTSDRLRVQEVLHRLAKRLNRHLTLSDLIDEWSRFVVSVNQGYGWSMDSYYHDLTVRDLIEEISESLSFNGRKVLTGKVKPVDDQFIHTTCDPSNPDACVSPYMEIGWWQFRIPKNPVGKLRADLEKLGQLPEEASEVASQGL